MAEIDNIKEVKRDRLIDLIETTTLVRCKKSTIYTLMKQGKFPKPIKLGSRMVAWPESLVYQWIQDQINQSQEVTQ